jgi:hypothetical protein
MAIEAFNQTQQEGVNAAFLRNHRGDVCIAFADPAYVRAEKILIDPSNQAIHAILHGSLYFLGAVSDVMVDAFHTRQQALLTSLRPDGTIFEVMVPVEEKEVILKRGLN